MPVSSQHNAPENLDVQLVELQVTRHIGTRTRTRVREVSPT